MKKLIIALCMAFAGIGASAQSGEMAVGVDLGVVPFLEGEGSPTNFEIGAKFRYGLTEAVRLEADLDYAFQSKNVDVFSVSANAHYLIPVSDGFKLYPLVGIGYGRVGWSESYDFNGDFNLTASTSLNRFLFNVGIGADYAIAENLDLNLEFKYQYMKDFNRLPIKIGITYKF